MVKRVILLVGLPGSGKTNLGNKLVEDIEDSVFFDEVLENIEEKTCIQNACAQYKTVIISSPFLCVEQARENVKKFFKSNNKSIKLEWKYFDYDVKTCIENKPTLKKIIFENVLVYTIPTRTKKHKVELYE